MTGRTLGPLQDVHVIQMRRCFRRSVLRSTALAASLAFVANAASAQKVDDNAVTQAADAFGINVDGENLGLYSPVSVRGFSPTAAGNLRLDGLLLHGHSADHEPASGRLPDLRRRVRAGHPFPAPSGIADFTIRKPDDNILSVALNADSFGARFLEVDGSWRDAAPNLGITGGLSMYHRGNGTAAPSIAGPPA